MVVADRMISVWQASERKEKFEAMQIQLEEEVATLRRQLVIEERMLQVCVHAPVCLADPNHVCMFALFTLKMACRRLIGEKAQGRMCSSRCD